MTNKKIKKLISERTELLNKMANLSQMLHGSWVERYSVCSRPNCKCHTGQRHGPRHYLVINVNGRQRQKYIPNSKVELARAGIAEYKKLKHIVDRITQLNLLIMKEG